MIIERIDLNSDEYSAVESSLHMARYHIAKPVIKGKRVLDIACGNGYGTYFMKKWGAKEVVGVDICANSIQYASDRYKYIQDIEFICSDACDYEGDKFDIIVSFETIEHVESDIKYLENLKKNLNVDGSIIISCPNDHFYYKANEGNPYHLRKYTYEQFMEKCNKVFGEPVIQGVGTHAVGVLNVLKPFDSISSNKTEKMENIILTTTDEILRCSSESQNMSTEESCLYYFGIWGVLEYKQEIAGGCIFPINSTKARVDQIDSYRDAFERAESLVINRDKAIKAMEQMIDSRDESIKAMEQMIDSRDESIRAMEEMIDLRDKLIRELKQSAQDKDGKSKND